MPYLHLLRRNPQFARLWAAQAISLIGDWFNSIVVFALVSDFSEGSGAAISLLLLARFLPPLLLAPVAGVLLDRYDRKRLMIASDILRSVIVVGFLFATTPDRLWLIYLLTVLQFSLSAIFEPGRSAFTPAVVRKEDLVEANVLSSQTWSLALAIGGALGGLVAGAFGVQTALLLDALTFGFSAAFIWSIRPDQPRPPQPARTGGASLRDFVEGLQYAGAHPEAGTALMVKFGGSVGAVDTLLALYATVLFPLFIVGVTTTDAQAGSLSLGLLWTAFGIGALAGPILFQRFGDESLRSLRRGIIAAYALLTVGWLIFGSAPSLAVAALAMLVKAMGSNIYWTYSSVILQKTVEDRFLGRMFALDMAGFQLATVLSVTITGAVLEAVGTAQTQTVTLWTAAASLIPLTVWALVTRWHERRTAVVPQPHAEPLAGD
jgi:predicted MFS family arabinose efflux permease